MPLTIEPSTADTMTRAADYLYEAVTTLPALTAHDRRVAAAITGAVATLDRLASLRIT